VTQLAARSRRVVTGDTQRRDAALGPQASIQYVPHLSPLPTVSGSDLSSVELPGDGVEACKAGRLDVSNDRQDFGRKLRRLRFTGCTHSLHGPIGSGVPSRLPRALAAARAALSIWLSTRVSELWLVPGNSTPAAR
jgi:hypothetical protein